MTFHVLSVDDFTETELLSLSDPDLVQVPPDPAGEHGLLVCFFQQPSLRTMSSFLGGALKTGFTPVQVFSGGDALRDQAELDDELVQLAMLCSMAVVRTKAPLNEGLLRSLRTPFVNAGDGSNEHPTQAIVDLMALRKAGVLEGKQIGLMGNLRDHRTQHSLVKILNRFGVDVTLISPLGLAMPHKYSQGLAREVETSSKDEVDQVLSELDLLYVTPVQFWGAETKKADSAFFMDLDRVTRVCKPEFKLFHPFPRLGELHRSLDLTKHDGYTEQARQGPLVRERVLRFVRDHA